MRTRALFALALLGALTSGKTARSDDDPKVERATRIDGAIASGVAVLASTQAADGHFGHDYPVAITAMAGLAILAAKDDALSDPTLVRVHAWLRAQQKDGRWPQDGSTWVHSQGFATLFFAELYGRVLTSKGAPDGFAKEELRATVAKAVALLEDAQSKSGGWNYTKTGDGDEGSTTVCAVQSLRAARNFGIAVEPKVLERGFAYLKAMQNPDGGFRYSGPSGGSMSSGTAAAVATLVLMSKLDERVLFSALKFLDGAGVKWVESNGYGQYGLFYSAMAMRVLGEEYGDHLPLAARWTREVEDRLLNAERSDGGWDDFDFGAGSGRKDYGTSLAVLSLAGSRGRLSVFHRKAPKLPG